MERTIMNEIEKMKRKELNLVLNYNLAVRYLTTKRNNVKKTIYCALFIQEFKKYVLNTKKTMYLTRGEYMKQILSGKCIDL